MLLLDHPASHPRRLQLFRPSVAAALLLGSAPVVAGTPDTANQNGEALAEATGKLPSELALESAAKMHHRHAVNQPTADHNGASKRSSRSWFFSRSSSHGKSNRSPEATHNHNASDAGAHSLLPSEMASAGRQPSESTAAGKEPKQETSAGAGGPGSGPRPEDADELDVYVAPSPGAERDSSADDSVAEEALFPSQACPVLAALPASYTVDQEFWAFLDTFKVHARSENAGIVTRVFRMNNEMVLYTPDGHLWGRVLKRLFSGSAAFFDCAGHFVLSFQSAWGWWAPPQAGQLLDAHGHVLAEVHTATVFKGLFQPIRVATIRDEAGRHRARLRQVPSLTNVATDVLILDPSPDERDDLVVDPRMLVLLASLQLGASPLLSCGPLVDILLCFLVGFLVLWRCSGVCPPCSPRSSSGRRKTYRRANREMFSRSGDPHTDVRLPLGSGERSWSRAGLLFAARVAG